MTVRDLKTVQDLIGQLSKHNPEARLSFSVEDIDSVDPGERWFAEDGAEFVSGNGHPELKLNNESTVTIGLLVRSNQGHHHE